MNLPSKSIPLIFLANLLLVPALPSPRCSRSNTTGLQPSAGKISSQEGIRLPYQPAEVVESRVAQPQSFPPLPSLSSIIPVSGSSCVTDSGDKGTCYSQAECDAQGGVKDGTCRTALFSSASVCCAFVVKKCGETTVRNPIIWEMPSKVNNKVSCTLTFPSNPGINIAGTQITTPLLQSNSNIRSCQLRIDFLYFRLSAPLASTVCENDYFIVTGGSSTPLKLCGDSYADQHMYVSYNSEQEDISLAFFLTDATNKDWKLKITRIPCTSEDLAPDNCLQYFTKDSGQIKSFNYDQANPLTVRQLADQNYNICFKKRTGYCSICLSSCPQTNGNPGFFISKKFDSASSGATGPKCSDQLIIPGGTSDGSNKESVYCGTVLNPVDEASNEAQVCTTSDRITYITDNMEDPKEEANNLGFCMTYTQKKC